VATNLELKVRCGVSGLDRVRQLAENAGIGPFSRIVHRDTYFHAARGRLKLRELRYDDDREAFELIGYRRPDEGEARWSHYIRAELSPAGADEVRLALVTTLGVARIVDKVRDVAIWKRTRIHLDEVSGIGLFVELETVTSSAHDESAAAELAEVVAMLRLDELETVSGSYGDLPRISA
jgi:adenylate cyclase class IV